ncbi:MAG: DNA adenine methylase [Deltaproteobacteria bacterium]|nr:DNA adenine methylase [Deltaproteobacteria bacterium]
MIKYLGSKRLLVPRIVAVLRALPRVRTVLDLFSGTSRVGHALKRAGLRVTANDHLAFAHALARCYVAADAGRVRRPAERLLAELARVPPAPGWLTATYCERARFFHPKNGARIDAIREAIAARDLPPDLEAVALVSLMEAADRVDSTTGVQMAYLKRWAPRALNDLELRVPELLPGPGTALRLDAAEAARQVEVDAAYLDPPYNQHSYLGNYHVWESLVRWDKPEVYGTAQKRVDCRDYRNPFNSKRRIRAALTEVLDALRARWLVVSFSDEGYLARPELERVLADHGHVEVLEVDFKRYVGAQIGIYNPRGEKVGRVSHLRNREHLFLVGPDRAALRRARDAAAAPDAAQLGLF